VTTDLDDLLGQLRTLAGRAGSDAEVKMVISRISKLTRSYQRVPSSPAEQAQELDSGYQLRPHITYLSDRIAAAVRDVEAGQNRFLVVSLPPRAGKSTLLSVYSVVWLLRRHPDWKIVSASHDDSLAIGWARQARRIIEENPDLGVQLQKDGGAAGAWSTIEGGGLFSTSVRKSLLGRGARTLWIDDPLKDFVEAHSPVVRQSLWDWWLSVAQTRLEPPYLVGIISSRWNQDDLTGRLLSDEFEGDSAEWEEINIPAIAESGDVIGRLEGDPLFSPLITETREAALERWEKLRRGVGSYVWAAMFQGRPSPSTGSIFDTSWWRYWTSDPARATDDGRVVYLEPERLTGASWLDSWDCAFKGTADSDWVVGQRWVRSGANRYLVDQKRGRWTFTQTIEQMLDWADPSSFCGSLVHRRLIEDKANGTAIIDVLREKIAGLKPVNPTISKEARYRAVTPEIESGNTYLPHPSEAPWVNDLLSELRDAPRGQHDDMADSLAQALAGLRDVGRGSVAAPGRRLVVVGPNHPQAPGANLFRRQG
jgi:predicted phage terminase large subunit-like protein